LFLTAWMILPIIPVLNISVFSAGDIAHDRFLYLPSVGFSILVAAGLKRLKGRSPSLFGEPGLQVVSVCAIACIFGVLTVNQEQFWQDDLALYSRGVASAPMNTAAANNLALALVEKGSAQQALGLLQSAIARNPDHWISSYNLGFLYYKLGNDEDAERYLRQALNLNPKSSRANFFLGMVLLDSGHSDAAKWSIDRAIEIGPVQSGFYYGQGLVLERQGKTSEALEAYKKELSLSPGQAELVARIKAIEGQSPNPDEHGNIRESADRTAEVAPHKELAK
jgi:protein O-mannosyl-transferase